MKIVWSKMRFLLGFLFLSVHVDDSFSAAVTAFQVPPAHRQVLQVTKRNGAVPNESSSSNKNLQKLLGGLPFKRLLSFLSVKNKYRRLTSNSNKKNTLDLQAHLWQLLSEAPPNQATPVALTQDILQQIRKLELVCPTQPSQVLEKLAGTWELVWTAQDKASQEAQRGLFSWIGPLENQSYSNNNNKGRSNPILPPNVQEGLERAGILGTTTTTKITNGGGGGGAVSTQLINLPKHLATNVVSFRLFHNALAISFAVNIHLKANPNDPRRVDVDFQSCRIQVPAWKLDTQLPLGLIGLPKGSRFALGWLRTTYIDDHFRITRGHKGSVFVLARPKKWSSRRISKAKATSSGNIG